MLLSVVNSRNLPSYVVKRSHIGLAHSRRYCAIAYLDIWKPSISEWRAEVGAYVTKKSKSNVGIGMPSSVSVSWLSVVTTHYSP